VEFKLTVFISESSLLSLGFDMKLFIFAIFDGLEKLLS
jgi:hypothetical protein